MADEKDTDLDFDLNEDSAEEVTTESRDLYNVNDGIHGRDGGPYLDQVEMASEERKQALREGKKPNYANPRGYPGVQLKTAAQLVDGYNPTLIAGDDRRDASEIQAKPVTSADFVVPSATDVVVDGPLEDDPTKSKLTTADLQHLI